MHQSETSRPLFHYDGSTERQSDIEHKEVLLPTSTRGTISARRADCHTGLKARGGRAGIQIHLDVQNNVEFALRLKSQISFVLSSEGGFLAPL